MEGLFQILQRHQHRDRMTKQDASRVSHWSCNVSSYIDTLRPKLETVYHTHLQINGVKSINEPDDVGHVELQSGPTQYYVPHTRCVCRADVRLSREWAHCKCSTGRHRLNATKPAIQIVLSDKIALISAN